MRMTSIVLSAALLIASPAIARNNSKAAPEAASQKTAKGEKLVCKYLPSTGTRMEERVCLTKEDWKKVERGY